jgi:hypothetical protein
MEIPTATRRGISSSHSHGSFSRHFAPPIASEEQAWIDKKSCCGILTKSDVPNEAAAGTTTEKFHFGASIVRRCVVRSTFERVYLFINRNCPTEPICFKYNIAQKAQAIACALETPMKTTARITFLATPKVPFCRALFYPDSPVPDEVPFFAPANTN